MQKFGPYAALGTQWWIEFLETVDVGVPERMVKIINDFEADYSRFNINSLVGKLNIEGYVAGDLKELPAMLCYGQKIYQESDGLFNILTGGRQVAAGYGQVSRVKVGTVAEADPLKDLTIDGEIKLLNGAVDLGGYGKGWLIDKLKDELLSLGVKYFIVNGGGDIYATSQPDGSSVEVYVEHPVQSGLYIAKVPLLNQSLAVSSSLKRNWQKDDIEFNHLHVKEKIATHVLSSTALLADTVATRLCLGEGEIKEDYEYLVWQGGGSSCSRGFKEWLLS